MIANQALPVRLWRMQPCSSNPLMRPSDRCESLVRLLVVVWMLALVPIAAAAGTVAYTNAAEEIRAENATKVQVMATTIGETTPKTVATPYGPRHDEALVRWEDAGRSGTATVPVNGKPTPGSVVPVWIGADGRLTDAPRLPGSAAADGVAVAVAALLLGGGGALWLESCATWALNTLRHRRWDVEWRTLARPVGT
ncbi:Rv1733c family protein [Nocardia aurantiaca]|uniref:Uncharacterized protein n=1 Tax=Nocardia aurantiaca TaxID=2675850 RepID=A0A6I3KXC0_9NOCA|nr:hypothetical protein [Nocardia aurantiaca]MTE14327.1 hypothetical protein [Nocardia aurantiaca]